MPVFRFFGLALYFIIKFISFLIKIIKSELNDDIEIVSIRIKNLVQIVLLSNFFNLINSPLLFLMFYYLAEFLDKKNDLYLFYSIYMMTAYYISKLVYSFLKKLDMFKLANENSPSFNSHHITFGSSLLTPILTYCSNMMIVCSSSGVCTQVYMSTIASLLGAFGVTLSDFSEYLFPITVVLLGISLISLYIKRRSFLHKPFILGCVASFMIVISHIIESLYYLMYLGNVLMIGAAIWNARMNKFYGLPRYNK